MNAKHHRGKSAHLSERVSQSSAGDTSSHNNHIRSIALHIFPALLLNLLHLPLQPTAPSPPPRLLPPRRREKDEEHEKKERPQEGRDGGAVDGIERRHSTRLRRRRRGGGKVGAGPAVDGQGMRDCAGRGGVRRGVCFMLEGDVDVMRWQQRLRGWCP